MLPDYSFLNIAFLFVAFIGYFIGFMFFLISFSHKRDNLSYYANKIAWATFIIHSISIIFRALAVGYFPITKLFETLSFFAWCIVLIFIIINRQYKLPIVGLIILPLSFICLGYALVVPKVIAPLSPILQSRLFYIHIILGFLSYASFVVAFVAGIIYTYQEQKIKAKDQNIWHYHLPSLEVVDEVNYRAIIFGFPLFTLSIISGAIWAQQVWGSYWSWDPKQTAALATWMLYSVHLHTRLASGWRGRKTAYLSIIGFLFILFTYIGLHYLGLGSHTYGK